MSNNFEEIIKAIGIEPYYRDWQSDIVIYNADCRDILPKIPDKSIDLVLTDPPWNLNYFADDNHTWEEYAEWLENIKQLCLSVSDIVWIFQSTKAIPYVAQLFKDWFMFASIKNFCQMTPKHIPNAFDIAFFNSHSNYKGNGRNWHLGKTSIINNNSKEHPTSRPIDTITYILNMYEINIVLDPFLGSGTTAVACKKLDRKCIGIEIEQKYCDIAVKRLAQGVLL